jgi:hypothetical protein
MAASLCLFDLPVPMRDAQPDWLRPCDPILVMCHGRFPPSLRGTSGRELSGAAIAQYAWSLPFASFVVCSPCVVPYTLVA